MRKISIEGTMKRLGLIVILLSVVSGISWGTTEVTEAINLSSFTLSNDNSVNISTFPGDELINVVVSSVSGANSGIVLYDGTQIPYVSTISIVNMNQVQNPFFYIRVSSGLAYKTTGNVSGVTIIWRPRNPKNPLINTTR